MSERVSTFWRRLDWRVWRQSYIAHTHETERLAWIRPVANVPGSAPQAAPSEEQCAAHVRDVSLGGLLLIVNRQFTAGTLLRVEVQNTSGGPALGLLARVLHVSARSGGRWLLSCCFAKELTDEDLRVFGAERVRPASADGRAWVRFPCQADSIFHHVIAADYERSKGKVLNISAGGLALQVDRQCEPGTLLSIELRDNQNQTRKLMARVVHVTARPEGDWVLGCTFVSELNDTELQALM